MPASNGRKASSLEFVERAAKAALEASANRDRAIRDAHSAGESARTIGRAAGLSHQRIHQIIHGR
jgi:hypothetical protein